MNFAKLSSKIILFLLTILFWSASACLAYVGVNILSTYEVTFDMVSYLQSVVPAFIILGVAVLMMLIGVIGLCGVFSENRCLLGTFFFLLATLLSLEISCVVLIFLYRDHVNKYIKTLFDDVLDSYGKKDSLSLTQNFDYLQHKLHCCGQYNYTDWQHDSWWYKNSPNRVDDALVPPSCCVGYVLPYSIDDANAVDQDDRRSLSGTSALRRMQQHRVAASALTVMPTHYCTGKSPQPVPADNYFVPGCFTRLKHLIREQFLYISGVVLALVIIQLTGLVAICVLIMCRSSKRGKQQPPYINIATHEDVNYHL